MSYRMSDCTSAAASNPAHAVPFTLPLDPQLQARSLHPLGTLQYNRPYASFGFVKAAATLALPSPDATNDALKLEALSQLLDALVRPEGVVQLLQTERLFAELLLSATANESAPVRQRASKALEVVTRTRGGREFALTTEVAPRLARLADSAREQDEQVRRNALQIFLNLAASAAGILHLMQHGLLKQLISKLPTETDATTHALCARTLAECVREPRAWSDAVAEGVVGVSAQVLRAKLDDVAVSAAADRVREANGIVATADKPLMSSLEQLFRLVGHVSAPALSGKDACVEADLVALLTRLLEHPVPLVRGAAGLALQNLTNAESGKRAALKCDTLAPLCRVALQDEDEMAQAQAMQSLANLAEHPTAKTDPRVTDAVEQLRRMQQQHASDKVRHAAKLAVDQITWQP